MAVVQIPPPSRGASGLCGLCAASPRWQRCSVNVRFFLVAAAIALVLAATQLYDGTVTVEYVVHAREYILLTILCLSSAKPTTPGSTTLERRVVTATYDPVAGVPHMEFGLLVNGSWVGKAVVNGGWPVGVSIAHFFITITSILAAFVLLGLRRRQHRMVGWGLVAVAYGGLVVVDTTTLVLWNRDYCPPNAGVVTAGLAPLNLKAPLLTVDKLCGSGSFDLLVVMLGAAAFAAAITVALARVEPDEDDEIDDDDDDDVDLIEFDEVDQGAKSATMYVDVSDDEGGGTRPAKKAFG
ncbi:Aste57867_10311 [Aphanomyces stellatus]|uniref:Aste57867_10311 protein n=1 Tax=Aphanomyces stellatus TaxID=120398 RepID=A0A485KQU1_9STRA|nr:hypothetical protein As57867_010271 [Aphanomyces stellatus]VFT87185.1 Aste57867_10311 [Aphanomyces stellatus]